MKYLKKFNESKIYKDLSVEEVKNMLVELLDIGFDVKITSTNGLCKTRGYLSKNIDMVDFLDNLLSFITKMEHIGGYERMGNVVSFSEKHSSFIIDFKLKDFIRNPSDVTDYDSFEGYITNIGFKYINNQAEVDLYIFNNVEVVFDEEGFFISIEDIYDEEKLNELLKNYTDEEANFLTKNISLGSPFFSFINRHSIKHSPFYIQKEFSYNEHPYNKESIEILEKIVKIVK